MTRRSVLGAVALASLLSLAACTPTPTVAPSTVAPSTVAPTVAPTTASASATPTTAPAEGTRHAAYFGSARASGGRTYLSFDIVLFLTGPEAEDAAEALGEESPPPNDYFILNHTTRQREFAVADPLSVSVVLDAEGMLCPDITCPPMTLDAWLAAVTPGESPFRSMPYWITVEDATITRIEQQYLP